MTEEDVFAARCGRGMDGGSNVFRTGGGNVDTTCEALNAEWDDVVTCEIYIEETLTVKINNVPRRSCARDLDEGMSLRLHFEAALWDCVSAQGPAHQLTSVFPL